MALHPTGSTAARGARDCGVVLPAAGDPRQEEQGDCLRVSRAAIRRQPEIHHGGTAHAPAGCRHRLGR